MKPTNKENHNTIMAWLNSLSVDVLSIIKSAETGEPVEYVINDGKIVDMIV